MNRARLDAALAALATAARDLALLCDRELPRYATFWHSVARDAVLLRSNFDRREVEALFRDIVCELGYRRDSFQEEYIQRDDFDEQEAENARLDQLKDRVSKADSEAWAAVHEGEVNSGAIRRHLTEIETVLLDAKLDVESARRLREFLSAGETDLQAAQVLVDEFARREWPAAVRQRVLGLVSRLQWELAPEPDRPWKRE